MTEKTKADTKAKAPAKPKAAPKTAAEKPKAEAKAAAVKTTQFRYIFKDDEKGWYEKEKDNSRVTKYYKTQKEAVDAAKAHIKNSGLPGRVVIQSKTGKIRANEKVAKKKPAAK